jgi:integrase
MHLESAQMWSTGCAPTRYRSAEVAPPLLSLVSSIEEDRPIKALVINRSGKLPAFVKAPLERYQKAWKVFEYGAGPKPLAQTQVSVPDTPNLYLQIYYTGAMSWRSVYNDPMTRDRTCSILGRLEELSVPEAIAAHVKLQQMVAEGRSPHGGKLVFEKAFLEHVVPNSIAKGKKSVKDDLGKYALEFRDSLGPLPIGKITPFMVGQEARRIREKKTPATAEHYVAWLRATFRDFVDLGLLGSNPATGLKQRKVENARDVIATDGQLARLGATMGAEPESQTNDFFQMLMFTGARAGELLKCKFSDIDEVAGVYRMADSKSGGPQDILLTPEFMSVYARRKAACQDAYLFPSKSGAGPMSYPRKAFLKLLERAGVSGLTMHDFRRGFGTAGIQSPGVTVHDVSKLLRHSSVSVTEKHYLVAVDSRLRHAANLASQSVHRRLGLDRHCRAVLTPSCRGLLIDRRFAFVFAGSHHP